MVSFLSIKRLPQPVSNKAGDIPINQTQRNSSTHTFSFDPARIFLDPEAFDLRLIILARPDERSTVLLPGTLTSESNRSMQTKKKAMYRLLMCQANLNTRIRNVW